jgi:hypothetical protein
MDLINYYTALYKSKGSVGANYIKKCAKILNEHVILHQDIYLSSNKCSMIYRQLQ